VRAYRTRTFARSCAHEARARIGRDFHEVVIADAMAPLPGAIGGHDRNFVDKTIDIMTAIPTIDSLISLQRAFFAVLAAGEPRPWGVIWANPGNPNSHDSNHADLEIALPPEQLPGVLNEVAEWYRARRLQPRLRFFIPPNDDNIVTRAQAAGWKSAIQEQTFRAWPSSAARGELWPVPGLTLSVAGPDQLDGLLAVHSEGADAETAVRHRGVWGALSAHPDVDCLLARIDGEPAGAFACVWSNGWGNVEDVTTRERFRRRGICRAMLCYAQDLATKRRASGLYLYHVEEAPGRIYAAVGFQFVATVKQASLWLEA
jgi:hypothetical protein